MSSVEEIGLALQRFGIADYVVFVLMLSMCAAIGVYYGFFVGQVSPDDYLMGGRTMKTFPIAMSLIARLWSSKSFHVNSMVNTKWEQSHDVADFITSGERVS